MNISVVIPCFNDGFDLTSIVDELHKCRLVKEIIVVDDGSSKNTKNVLARINTITIVTHKSNQGKAKALLSGLMKASSENVLFLDSDLKNFSYKHVELLHETFCRRNLDMVLGIREKEIFYMKWIGFAQAYTGERMIKRSLLMKHLEVFSVDNYLIEPSINRLFFHHYKVGGVILKELSQVYKFQKNGLRGLLRDIQMYRSYLSYLGLKELLFQLNFARNSPTI